jgi:hypothetical protein
MQGTRRPVSEPDAHSTAAPAVRAPREQGICGLLSPRTVEKLLGRPAATKYRIRIGPVVGRGRTVQPLRRNDSYRLRLPDNRHDYPDETKRPP